MSKFKPTQAQQQAIECRNSAVLVSAGAGSGKTKVLTERLMGYIMDKESPADLDRFVIITFTKAAAAELKSRISEELSELSAAMPENEHIRRQTAILRKTHIGTIHSFCSSILRENSHAAGIPSDFSVISDERAEAMKSAALERVLNQYYEHIKEDPEFEILVNTIGAGRDDGNLVGLVGDLYDKMQCHPRPNQWIEEVRENLDKEYDDPAESPWGEVICEYAEKQLAYWSDELDSLLQEMQEDEAIARAYQDSLSESAAGVRELLRAVRNGWNAAAACPEVSWPKLGRCMKCQNEPLKNRITSRRDAAKKTGIPNIQKLFSRDSSAIREEMKSIAPPMHALLRVCSDFSEEYSKAKKRAGYVDYSDLEHMSVALLKDKNNETTSLAQSISDRYIEIMVDEYQDVSKVQDELFNAVSDHGKKLFMVGDVKQSIYRFRLANPKIFTGKYKTFKKFEEAAEGEDRQILLRENFRSDEGILNCANAVFRQCMTEELGDVAYGEDTKLIFGLGGTAEKKPEITVPEIDLYAVDMEDKKADKRRTFEAKKIAEKIQELRSQDKNLHYRDIAILLRNANSVGKIYSQELTEHGIPVATGAGGDLFKAEEIVFVLSLLKIMDNPHMDIPLLTVLSSPAFGFTPDELSSIRMQNDKKDIYGALEIAAEANEKCRDFLEKLNSLRESAPGLTADKLLWQIFDITNIQMICSAMKENRQRLANLMYLTQLAVSFESDGYHGLHNFVLYLQRMAEKGLEAPSLGEKNDAVTIMSIHKSKGLEFPVVFLSDTAHDFNTSDLKEKVVVHPDLGLGPQIVDLDHRIYYSSFAREAISLKLKRENLSEEMRLLYVAMTRPKHRLYITAALKDPEKRLEDIKNKMPSRQHSIQPEALAQARCMLDWLLAACFGNDGKDINLKIIDDSAQTADDVPLAEDPDAGEIDLEIQEQLKKNLSFVYPYSEAENLPSKVTATELKKYSSDTEEDGEAAFSIVPERKVRFRKPDFGKLDRPATGAERGIATHLALQYMNPEKTGSIENVKEELARLKEKQFLSERQAEAVNAEAIVKLFHSDLGKRIRRADRVHREFRFSLLCPVSELMNTEVEEKILLQGVVDCCLEENGALVIIDYKTDSISSNADLEEKKAIYSSQVKAYSIALSRIFSMPVKETVLYFLSVGKEIII